MDEQCTLSGMERIREQTYEAVGGVKQAVLEAIKVGYRHIDCASFYGNEIEGEGKGERLPRAEIFVTGKVWNDCQGLNGAFKAVKSRCAIWGCTTLICFLSMAFARLLSRDV